MNDNVTDDPRLYAIPDIHGHAKGEHKAFIDERPIPLSARMLFLWFYHACRRGWPRFLMVTDHMNYLTFEDPAAINLVRRALKLAQAGDLYGAAETASVEVGHAAVVSEGLRRGMRYSIGAEVDNDPRSRPDAQNIVDAMKPDGMIRSVHFLTIDHPTHGPNWNWPFDNPEFADVYEIVGTAKTWELYMATLLDAIERLPGNILGHFYVPAIFGHWPDDETLDGYENQLVDACEARGMAIELNTRFLYRDHPPEEKAKYLAAHRRLLAKCKAKNVGVAVGSDAHSPKDQGGGFETVLALLDECEINELVFPIAGRLARVALRVERKSEPVPETVAPAVEERKPARRPRPSENPAPEVPAAAEAEGDPAGAPPKPKARPKRSKAKAPAAPAPADAQADSAVDPVAVHVELVETGVVEIAAAAEPGDDAGAADVDVIVIETAEDELAQLVAEAEFDPIVTGTIVESTEPVSVAESDDDASADGPEADLEEIVVEPAVPAEAIIVDEIDEHEPELVAAHPGRQAPGDESDSPVHGTVAVSENVAANPSASNGVASIDDPYETPVEASSEEGVPRTDEPAPEIAVIGTISEVSVERTAPARVGKPRPKAAPPAAAKATSAKSVPVKPSPAKVPAAKPPASRAPATKAAVRKAAPPKATTAKAAPAKALPAKAKPAKKTAKPALKPAAKKVAAAKKAPAKKVAASKSTAKKSTGKKAPAKKVPAKKAAVRSAGVKKSATKKNAPKKAGAKKPAQRRR